MGGISSEHGQMKNSYKILIRKTFEEREILTEILGSQIKRACDGVDWIQLAQD
jgi:hypothetical protein